MDVVEIPARYPEGLRLRALILWCTSLIVGTAALARLADCATAIPAADIDHSVIATLTSRGVKQPTIISHIDLTRPFRTVSQWTLVIGRDNQPPPEDELAGSEDHGPVTVCFVKALMSDCSVSLYARNSINRWFGIPFDLLDSRVVYSDVANGVPMLLLKLCGGRSGDGNCGVATALYKYDQRADHFYQVFLNVTGRNNNEATRFVESGPLRGAVIVDEPTADAPYTYWIEVYRLGASGRYVRVLRYRGLTGYGDGDPMAVADSEMPEILRRLGLWRPGDPPPDGLLLCSYTVKRNGEVKCN